MARTRSPCFDVADTPAEKVVMIWIAGGSGPNTSMPGDRVRAMLAYMASPAADAAKRSNGMEPA